MKSLTLILLFNAFSSLCIAQDSAWLYGEVDSTCLQHPQLTVEQGTINLSAQLQMIIREFNEFNSVRLSSMLDFEFSIGSQENSLGYFYTISEGIYPFVKKYRFGIPKSFRRLECPDFDGQAAYFYTKRSKKVKLVLYTWKEFNLRTGGFYDPKKDTAQVRDAFKRRYDAIVLAVSNYLGKPQISRRGAERAETKWNNNSGTSAFLFMFAQYNEIRLAVYVK